MTKTVGRVARWSQKDRQHTRATTTSPLWKISLVSDWRHPLAGVNEDGQWPCLTGKISLMASRGTVVEGAIWLLLWQPLADKSQTLNQEK